MQERYSKILQEWFVVDPVLFEVLCTHELSANSHINCPVRSGRKVIEYNPEIVREMTDTALEEALRAEAVRILLKHPYERCPDGCSRNSIGLASNLVIGDNYSHRRLKIENPAEWGLESGMSYEWYARSVEEMKADGGGENGDNDEGDGRNNSESSKYGELAELWEEDEMMQQMINGIISSAKDWGTLSGEFAERLKSTLKAKINWRNVFAGFRASILSSKRKLTRMKPNRRSGFDNMGSVRNFDTRLLVAVDVSASISSKSLMYFYGVINSAFKYGIEEIDVVQFDCGTSTIKTLKRVVRDTTVFGRGGTSFQEPIDLAHKEGYDGLIILTDGYAPAPTLPEGFRTSLLWVCENERCYNEHRHWMERYGRVCVMQI